jgi:protein-S-isoprenylcysteine O-methyltransferase Ste14
MKIKITPDIYFGSLMGISILFHSIFPILKIISYPYSLIGIVLIITGILIAFIANSILLKKRTSIIPFEAPSVLITSGPFKFSRNPIYLGMAITLFGVETFLGSLSPFIFPVLFILYINKSVIPIEQKNLEKLFPEEYLDYKTKVSRWL